MEGWSADEVGQWLLKQGIKPETAQKFKEQDVDGEVLSSFTYEELTSSASLLSLTVGEAKKILLKRDKLISSDHGMATRVSDTSENLDSLHQPSTGACPQVKNERMKPGLIKENASPPADPSDGRVAKMIAYINGKVGIHIEKIEHEQLPENSREIYLREISSQKGKNANELEKNISVLILFQCKTNDVVYQNSQRIWQEVRKYTHHWIKLAPENSQLKYLPSSEEAVRIENAEGTVTDGLELRCRGVRLDFLCSSLAASIHKQREPDICILFVEKTLLQTDISKYYAVLDSTRKQNVSVELDSSLVYQLEFEVSDSLMQFHPSKHLTCSVNSASSSVLEKNVLKETPVLNLKEQRPRKFGDTDDTITYKLGDVLNRAETGSDNLIEPAREFKLFTEVSNILSEKAYQKFGAETMRFSCGCLNSRTNGTIYFGIGDSKTEQKHLNNGEIVGFEVENIAEVRSRYTEELSYFIEKSFQQQASTAQCCIRSPKFIKVHTPPNTEKQRKRYVMEVDVEPLHTQVVGKHFQIQSSIKNYTGFYIRKRSSSERIEDSIKTKFIYKELPKLDKQRQDIEEKPRKQCYSQMNFLAEKLQRLLCFGHNALDESIHPFLVVNKPSENIITYMKFIENVSWRAIIDFDEDCKLNNLYGTNAILRSPEDFTEASNVQEDIENILCTYRKCWIFGNGRSEIKDPKMLMSDWLKSRSGNINMAISHFMRSESKERAVIVFLLLSVEDLDLMAHVFLHCYQSGVASMLYITDNQDLGDKWKTRISDYTKDPKEAESFGIIGMPWQHVDANISRLTGTTSSNYKRHIITSNGTKMPLDKDFCHIWETTSILAADECDSIYAEMDDEMLQKQNENIQLQFYRGEQISWSNCWFTEKKGSNHVLKRNLHSVLRDKIDHALNNGQLVECVTIYHDPGCGGSTLARFCMWEYRAKYKCAIVKAITSETHKHVSVLYNYQEGDDWENRDTMLKPVLLLVEEDNENKFADFKRILIQQLRKDYSQLNHVVCIILHCKHTDNFAKCFSESSVILKQHLEKDECDWFAEKFKELENRGTIKQDDLLSLSNVMSFMILRENFSMNYVKGIVKNLLNTIHIPMEKVILKYIALINQYHLDNDTVECQYFDSLSSQNSDKPGLWEQLLSDASKLLLCPVTGYGKSKRKAFKIIHPLVATELLDQTLEEADGQTLSDAVKHLSEIDECHHFKGTGYQRKRVHSLSGSKRSVNRDTMLSVVCEMLTQRKKRKHGHEEDKEFSDLVMDIAEKETKAAAISLMVYVFDESAHAGLAQQIARVLCNLCEDFDEALKYAQIAIDMHRDNAFFWDTLGQTNRRKLCNMSSKLNRSSTKEDFQNAVKTGHDAMEAFNKSLSNAPDNYSAHKGILAISFEIINILYKLNASSDKALLGSWKLEIKHYLINKDYIVPQLQIYFSEYFSGTTFFGTYENFLKDLVCGIQRSLQETEDQLTMFKGDTLESDIFSELQKEDLRNIIGTYDRPYKNLFEGAKVGSQLRTWSEKNPIDENQRRRNEVQNRILPTFHSVFSRWRDKSHENNLEESRQLLEENVKSVIHAFDFRALLLVNVALACIYPKKYTGKITVHRIYYLCTTLAENLTTDEYAPRYVHYFLSMILWPRENMDVTYDDERFKKALQFLKRQNYTGKHEDACDIPVNYYQKPHRQTPRRRKATTLFFLTAKKGLGAFIYIDQLYVEFTGKKIAKGKQFWESDVVKNKLKRVEGVVNSNNTVRAFHPFQDDRPTIDVDMAIPLYNIVSRDRVYFYLGFSWKGPIAFKVEPINKASLTHSVYQNQLKVVPPPISMNDDYNTDVFITFEEYSHKKERLERKLHEIDHLKLEREKGSKLEKNQVNRKLSACEQKLQRKKSVAILYKLTVI